MHHKKQNSVVPLMDNFAPSELPQGGPGRESSEAEATAAVSSSKPSPGKVIVRRGSKNSSSSQRLYSECSSPSPPPVMRRSSSGASVGISSSLAAGTGLTPALPGALPDSTTQAPTQLVYNGSSPSSSLELGPSMEVAMAVDGHRALASLGPSGLRWSYDITRCCVPGVRSESVPFEEILAAEVLLPRRGMVWVQRPTKMFRLAVYTFRRAPDNPSSWHPRQIVLETTSEELVLQWSQTINAAVAQQPRRPRHLLVIVNPYGGAKQARALYQSVVQPVFGKAGIKMTVMETQRQGHARVIITDLPLSQLEGLDGVVAIGGDGLFHEIINGMLELRSHDGDERGRATQALRVGHIPAGSTDAVAYSLNGTRSAFTAACHIALGDGMPLDVLRIDTADGHHEFATCMASYGFMGDLMEESERYRWLGPKRYDLIGAKMLAHNRAYRVRVSYLPPPTAQQRGHSMVCHSHCQLCTMEKRPDDLDVAFREASHHSLARRGQEWQVVEGDFAGIMLVIMPCRSDKSAAGVAKYGHLCDGVVHLVLVRRCSRWQYLRFLLTMSNKGLEAGKMGGYIEVMPAVAVKVEPLGKESRWNVDGELLPSNHITSEVHRGLVEVFARGVER